VRGAFELSRYVIITCIALLVVTKALTLSVPTYEDFFVLFGGLIAVVLVLSALVAGAAQIGLAVADKRHG
jgi:hypothetical protein